jgi:ABC-2 type transport system permease protein
MTALLASGSFPAILVAEARGEIRKAWRMPAYLVPTIVFPALIYAVFGLMMFHGSLGGMSNAQYMLASYGTLGVVGASLFGMGVGIAAERGQGWLGLKAATPMPPMAYFGGKLIMCVVMGAVTFGLLALMAVTLGKVRLEPLQWAALFATLALGSIPFCALGCALGFLAGPNSAAGIANLIYLPLCLTSGLWIPVEALPHTMQQVAHYLPPYHLARLALHAMGKPDTVLGHVAILTAYTAGFLWIASRAFRRRGANAWG